MYLVVLSPVPSPWSVHPEKYEGILTADDQQDGEELQVRDEVTSTPEEIQESRREVRFSDARKKRLKMVGFNHIGHTC